ncbi:MAG: hypothetical protein R3B48_04130 [Kofleriaceae bacterium]
MPAPATIAAVTRLDDLQIRRYGRQIVLDAVGGRGQRALLDGAVVVCLGAPADAGDPDALVAAQVVAIAYLAGAGVGTLYLRGAIDAPVTAGEVGAFLPADALGQRRGAALARAVAALNPDVRVRHDEPGARAIPVRPEDFEAPWAARSPATATDAVTGAATAAVTDTATVTAADADAATDAATDAVTDAATDADTDTDTATVTVTVTVTVTDAATVTATVTDADTVTDAATVTATDAVTVTTSAAQLEDRWARALWAGGAAAAAAVAALLARPRERPPEAP